MNVANAPVTYFNTISTQNRKVKSAFFVTLVLVCDALFVRSVTDYRTRFSQIACRYIGCSYSMNGSTSG